MATKQVKKAVARSSVRISQEEYKNIAVQLRKQKLDVTPVNVVLIGTPILGRKLPASEVTDNRVREITTLIRELDAAEEAMAKAEITGSFKGMRNGETADLLIKGIVTAAIKASTAEVLEGVRKLMQAQEVRFQAQFDHQAQVMQAMCTEWGISLPEYNQPELLPQVEATGRMIRLPRILIYGVQANQKQPLFDKMREWNLHEVATVDIEYSTSRPGSCKRGYDVVIVNRHWVGVDDCRELKSHGAKYCEVVGAASAVDRQLKLELLEMAIAQKKDAEGRK